MFQFVLFGIIVTTALALILGLAGLFMASFRHRAKRIVFISGPVLLALILFIGANADKWAKREGFKNSADKAGAQQAGFSDPALWQKHTKEGAEIAARCDAAAKAAGFTDCAEQKAAAKEGVTSGTEWKRYLAKKRAEEESKRRYPLNLAIFSFAADYNLAAMQLGVSTRFAKVECPSGNVVCRYAAGSDVQAIISRRDDGNDSTADTVTLIFNGPQSRIPDLLLHVGVIMAILAPDATRDERGVAIKTLTEGLKRKASKGEAVLHGIRFTMTAATGMGIWLTVNDARAKT